MAPKSKSKPKSKSRKDSDRVSKPSARQRASDENKTNDAAKTAANKQRTRDAAARKNKRAANDAEAATLQNVTNTAPSQALSAEEQIAALTAQLNTANSKVEVLGRKNKLLKKTIRRAQPDLAAENTDITPIPKPKGKFNVQSTMGLDNNRAHFTEIQAAIRAIAVEAKIDFTAPWSQQDPSAVAKVLRVAAERHSYLSSKRFPRHWATSTILQRYINSVRAYTSGKANPTSGVNCRRHRVTNVGRQETDRRRRTVSPPAQGENQMDVDDAAGEGGSASPEPQDKQSPDSAPLIDGSDDDDEDNGGGGSQAELDDEDSEEEEEEEEELPVAAD
ncbi:hypothetical protein C8R45DRAFT_1096644 [Mycena sanguinolenta]|nr:hypothetical protein C8R45DRAFT_1096644 [Mycena sanguinolenta]